MMDEDKDESNESALKDCPSCNVKISSLSFSSHIADCFKKYEFEKNSPEIYSGQNPSCDACGKNLSHLNLVRQAQHMKRCSESQCNSEEKQMADQNAILNQVFKCPLCNSQFPNKSKRLVHVKRCGKRHGLPSAKIITAVNLFDKQLLEKVQAGLPVLSSAVISGRNLKNVKGSNNRLLKTDPDVAVALALSLSEYAEEEKSKKLEEEFIMESKEQSCQLSTPENLSKEAQMAKLIEPPQTKRITQGKRNKKHKSIPPLVLTTPEQRFNAIQARFGEIIMEPDIGRLEFFPPLPENSANPTEIFGKLKKSRLGQTHLRKGNLWDASNLIDIEDLSQFYVLSLREIIRPSDVEDVEIGSRFKRLSQIPGRRKSNFNDQVFMNPIENELQENFEVLKDGGMEICDKTNETSSSNHCSSETDFKDLKMSSEAQLISDFGSIANSMAYSDLDIAANGGVLAAHKVIILARCPKMYELIGENNEIDLKNFFYSSVKQLLIYLYSGQMKCKSKNEVHSLLKLAKHFDIKHLIRMCKYMNSKTAKASNEYFEKVNCHEESAFEQSENFTSGLRISGNSSMQKSSTYDSTEKSDCSWQRSPTYDSAEKPDSNWQNSSTYDSTEKTSSQINNVGSNIQEYPLLCDQNVTPCSSKELCLSQAMQKNQELNDIKSDDEIKPTKDVSRNLGLVLTGSPDIFSCSSSDSIFSCCDANSADVLSKTVEEFGHDSIIFNEDNRISISTPVVKDKTSRRSRRNAASADVSSKTVEEFGHDSNIFNEDSRISISTPVLKVETSRRLRRNVASADVSSKTVEEFGHDSHIFKEDSSVSTSTPVLKVETSKRSRRNVANNDELPKNKIFKPVNHELPSLSPNLQDQNYSDSYFKGEDMSLLSRLRSRANISDEPQKQSEEIICLGVEDLPTNSDFDEDMDIPEPMINEVKCNIAVAETIVKTPAPSLPKKMNCKKNNKNKVTKAVPITPLPHYSVMETPELKTNLAKYGLKKLPKKTSVKMLKYIYEETHPLVTDSEDDEGQCTQQVSCSQQVPSKAKKDTKVSLSQPAKTSKIKKRNTPVRSVKHKTKSNQAENENAQHDLLSSNALESSTSSTDGDGAGIYEESYLSSQTECSTQDASSFKEKLMEFIKGDKNLHLKILRYEPVVIEDLHADLKRNGIKHSINALIEFLDQQCITFRFNKQGRQNKKSKTRKKKK